MLNLRDRLTLKLFNGSTYSTVSDSLADFMRDTESFSTVADHYFYLGYHKPISNVYFDLPTAASASGTLTIEYYNQVSASWTALTNVIDETKGLSRSGFVLWDASEVENSGLQTVDSKELHWIRIQLDTEQALVIGGISMLFCDERDLKTENPNITDTEYLRGQTDQMPALIAARDTIIQELRNRGYIVTNDDGYHKSTGPWDLLNVDQVRVAAKYVALARIYADLSDEEGDQWDLKGQKYSNLYGKVMNGLNKVEVDANDDGQRNYHESNNTFGTFHMVR